MSHCKTGIKFSNIVMKYNVGDWNGVKLNIFARLVTVFICFRGQLEVECYVWYLRDHLLLYHISLPRHSHESFFFFDSVYVRVCSTLRRNQIDKVKFKTNREHLVRCLSNTWYYVFKYSAPKWMIICFF